MADGYQQGFDRQSPLPWAIEKTVTKGAVQVQVTSAVGRNEKRLFSWSLSRGTAEGGRATKHLRLDDIDQVIDALTELKEWKIAQGG
jgi:hypothetical protein